ncbi:hypothetical protein DEH84_11540 [Aquabacterium olei]|uniref:Uncharacterized protein n=1 Tax=Aquabacterium olei TaxID=1296669 RepID=A0A2U8FSI7_9BURK|nr:hypothetical protein [Aquabacterium olei]AWI53989.1 hypothetical protein DEH84_11540 [Aquabacterium olei]
MSQDSTRIALAARIHVALRRKTGRVTDTEWLAQDPTYATEIIRMCRAEGDAELVGLADKLDAAMQTLRPRVVRPVAPPPVAVVPAWADSSMQLEAERERERKIEQRYVGRLR